MSKNTYKKIDLFGNEEVCFVEKKSAPPKNLFTDHEGFVDKFKPKLTTDDCYTPKDVFNVVLKYVGDNFNLEGLEILRPFMPNGDYKAVDYSDSSIVIDNPPFSILAEIIRFYTSEGIKFFLFAPHLTLFSNNADITAVVVGANVIYDNGANVNTSFLTNLFEDVRILGAPKLLNELEAINEAKKANLPKYSYPEYVATVSKIKKIVDGGIEIKISKQDCEHCRGLDSQKKHKKTIFGAGFLLSEQAAQAQAQAQAQAEKDPAFVWELSKRELEIIKNLRK